MIAWQEWQPEVFLEAQRRGAPVLLLLPSGLSPNELEAAFQGLEAETARCVPVFADRCDRPDIHGRYAHKGEVCLLNHDGDLVAHGKLTEARTNLPLWLKTYAPPAAGSQSPTPPAWSGAVGVRERAPIPADKPRKTLQAVLAATSPLSFSALELLLYASSQWNDEAARVRLASELDAAAVRLKGGARTLSGYATAARLFWDAYAVAGRPQDRAAALALSEGMLTTLYDLKRRAFRHDASPASDFFADENAQAVLALQRAAAFEPGFRFGQTADEVLSFLRDTAYDPVLGMIHRRQDGGTMVYGLLGDSAWTILAFCEAFLMTGNKAHREFADSLTRFLFQELWDRDGGGFLDRMPQKGDAGLLRQPRSAQPDEHAVAFEGLWRLHHLKGNTNYRRWLDWGLAAMGGVEGSAAAGLARVQDIVTRGRLDLELIGRPGDPASDALLAALNRRYAPRRVVSFVDPDDQDYILAHKLEAPSYPRLFGCGPDLRPVASADSPEAVAGLLEALS